MNLFACLGVGPGHRLLLGPLTPGATYASATRWDVPALPPERPAHRRRCTQEVMALRNRVTAALRRGDTHAEIELREGITKPYISWIATKFGGRKRRTRDEADAVVSKALRLRTETPSLKLTHAAKACGVTAGWLAMALERRGRAWT